MKMYFIFLCLLISSGLACASIQTAVSQDKPPHVYVKNYKMSDQASGTYHYEDSYYGYSEDQTLTYNADFYGLILGTNGLVGAGTSSKQVQYIDSDGYSETDDDYWVEENMGFVPNLIDTEYTSGVFRGTGVLANASFPIYQEHCDINGTTHISAFSPDGSAYISQSVTHKRGAQAVLKLQTGGKATSRLRNLVGLTGSAAQGIPVSFMGSWGWLARAYWYQSSGTNFPSQYITIGSYGKLCNDGNVYVALPDNADVDVTPYVAGVDYYSFNVNPQKYKLTIVARGNGTNYDLSTNTPEFCVGQLLTFQPSWSPSTPPYFNSVQHWTLPDKYVNRPTNYSATCATYVKNTDLLTNRVNQCWYVNGSGGTASIGMSLQFANGQTASIAAKGDFTIYRPRIWLGPYDPGEENHYYTISYANEATCKLKLGENDDSGNGAMRFDVDINSKYSGSIGLTQLITANYSNPTCIFSDERCDGTEYYSGPNAVTARNDSSRSGLISMDDGPNSIWVTPNIVNLSSRDFVRFQPVGGIPVTVGIVTWDTVGVAETILVPDDDWHITTDATTGPNGPDSSDEFPVWTKNVGGMR
jgi:hypothetical protein